MDSPPHLFNRPTTPPTPATPTKASRPRLRVLNRPVKKHMNCKRCLFGRPNHGEVSKWLDQEMQSLNMEQRSRWNFDFATMTPLTGGDWQWERVPNPTVIPAPALGGVKNPSSFAPMSPPAAQQASFRLPDIPLVGATRPPSISDDSITGLNRSEDEVDSDDAEDVFGDATAAGPPAKRVRLNSDSNDENANPAFCGAIRSSLPFRIASQRRDSVARTTSESSSDSDMDLPAFSSTSPSSSSTKSLFKDPSTPSRASLGDSASSSPPPRLTRAKSTARDSTKSASASQTRLQRYFAVKRRGSEAGSGIATGSAPADRLSHLRKRIDF